ncbi:hypothetical protein Leryth_006465 [Lithospermum erythrorhizon]|nr:hypothetical protein Leryth_006465 [Lithospermum erythrorhizon]
MLPTTTIARGNPSHAFKNFWHISFRCFGQEVAPLKAFLQNNFFASSSNNFAFLFSVACSLADFKISCCDHDTTALSVSWECHVDGMPISWFPYIIKDNEISFGLQKFVNFLFQPVDVHGIQIMRVVLPKPPMPTTEITLRRESSEKSISVTSRFGFSMPTRSASSRNNASPRLSDRLLIAGISEGLFSSIPYRIWYLACASEILLIRFLMSCILLAS